LALHIIKALELETKRIHHDTTTITCHGAYKQSVDSLQLRLTMVMPARQNS